jgi:hypothetical protein
MSSSSLLPDGFLSSLRQTYELMFRHWEPETTNGVFQLLLDLSTPRCSSEKKVLRWLLLPLIEVHEPAPYGTDGIRILDYPRLLNLFWGAGDGLAWMLERRLSQDTTIDRSGIERVSRKFQGILQLLFTDLSLKSDHTFTTLPGVFVVQVLVCHNPEGTIVHQLAIAVGLSLNGALDTKSLRQRAVETWQMHLMLDHHRSWSREDGEEKLCGENPAINRLLHYLASHKKSLTQKHITIINLAYRLPRKTTTDPGILTPLYMCDRCKERCKELLQDRTVKRLKHLGVSLHIVDASSKMERNIVSFAGEILCRPDSTLSKRYYAAEA